MSLSQVSPVYLKVEKGFLEVRRLGTTGLNSIQLMLLNVPFIKKDNVYLTVFVYCCLPLPHPNSQDDNAVQMNPLLMWLHHKALRILADFSVACVCVYLISCNILLRPVLHENVTCMQEKVFVFFLSHYLEKLI